LLFSKQKTACFFSEWCEYDFSPSALMY
jgi:hypothetical protein